MPTINSPPTQSPPAGVSQSMWALREEVDKNDGVTTVSMGQIRDAFGRDRLGKNIRDEIAQMLWKIGLIHQPKQLPSDQSYWVRLYRRGSPVAEIIEAAYQWYSEAANDVLRDAANQKVASTLEKVREAVESLQEILDE